MSSSQAEGQGFAARSSTLEEGRNNPAQQFFDHNLAASFRSSLEGDLLDCNSAFLRIFGFSSREEALACGTLALHTDSARRNEIILHLQRQGVLDNLEITLRRKDGQPFTAICNVHFAEDVRGEFCVLEGTILDITEQHHMQVALAETEACFRLLFSGNPHPMFIYDAGSLEILAANDATLAQYGYRQNEFLKLRLMDIHPPGEPDRLAAAVKAAREGPVLNFEWKHRHRDGRIIDVEVSSRPLSVGDRTAILVVARDVTSSRKAEETIGRIKRQDDLILGSIEEGIFGLDMEGRVTFLNASAARVLGYSPEEVIGANGHNLWHHSRADGTPYPVEECSIYAVIRAGEATHARDETLWRRDGTAFPVELQTAPLREDGRLIGAVITFRDVTERRRAEMERQVTFEIIHGVNVTGNLDDLLQLIHRALGRVLYAENCYVALFDPATRLFHFQFHVDKYDETPSPQLLDRSCTAYVLATGRALLIKQSEFDALVAQGDVELVGTPSPAWIGVPLRTSGTTIGVLVLQHYEDENAYTHRDLEFLESVGNQIALAIERKRSEDALRSSEERLRLLVEQLPAVLWTVDDHLRFTTCLGSGLGRLGLRPSQVVGMSLSEYFQTADECVLPIAAHRRALAGESITFHMEWAGGSYVCHAEPLRNPGGRPSGVICMALDITDRKQLEAQLRQAQKMEAVGCLAGGIAHDFNNLLMVIQGYTDVLLEGLQNIGTLHRSAQQVHTAADRAATLTRQLLAFSRKQVLAPSVLDLDAVVADLREMLHRVVGEDVEILASTQPGLWNVRADRNQVEQVLMNLTVNARDAMPRGGKLTIETANITFDDACSDERPMVAPGAYVMLAVSDTGTGMTPEIQGRIFEPFFTTKEQGQGTGLGLATVYGIVKQSGGYIWVHSEPGHGSSFKVYLPRAEEPAVTRDVIGAAEIRARGTETILVVEDEAGVRDLARETLSTNGYQVLAASSAAEAIEVVRGHTGEIHLLLTDVVMPGLSGRELAEGLAELHPGIRVLFMSGYADEAVLHHGLLVDSCALLQKPFTMSAMVRKIRAVLDERRES